MTKSKKEKNSAPELRYDLVNNDWVVIGKKRTKKWSEFENGKKRKKVLSKDCFFCHIETQNTPTLIFAGGKEIPFKQGDKIPKNWTTVCFPNKFPAFEADLELETKRVGKFFSVMSALGFHEVVATRDHNKPLALLPIERVRELIDVYQSRYLKLMEYDFVNYIFIFQNHGPEAGASVYHPHSQIITTFLVDQDLAKTTSQAKEYSEKNKGCIYCEINKWEREQKERVVFENEHFIAICPFAYKSAFQVIISPQKHLSYFEKITEEEKNGLAEVFKKVLTMIYKGLDNPSYNFYLHTSPCDGKNHDSYHWHWTILPKTYKWAGFELGAKMEILGISPEEAAAFLRKQK